MPQGRQSVRGHPEGNGLVNLDTLTTKMSSTDQWAREAAGLANSGLDQIPGLAPDAPWSLESLRRAERILLETPPSDLEGHIIKNYEQYLGEGLIRRFGGHWVLIAPEVVGLDSDAPSARGVAFAGVEHVDVVDSLVHRALQLQTGDHWASVFETTETMLVQAQQ